MKYLSSQRKSPCIEGRKRPKFTASKSRLEISRYLCVSFIPEVGQESPAFFYSYQNLNELSTQGKAT